nr:MAG: cell division protein FtsW [Bacteroidota bacterium]
MKHTATELATPVDRVFLWTVLALVLLGTWVALSAMGSTLGPGSGGTLGGIFVRRLAHVAIGLVVLALFSRLDYHLVARWSRLAAPLSLVLVGGVLLLKGSLSASARWLEVAGLTFQPSEIARVALLVFLATLLERKQRYIREMDRALLPALFWIGLGAFLLGLSSLSAALLLILSSFLLLILARIPFRQLVLLGVLGAALVGFALWQGPYRWERLERFYALLRGEKLDVLGEDYQVVQSLIAVANGGILGVGMGKSLQRDFLPLPYNDFVFAILAEEYGLVGAAGVMGLFLMLFVRGIFFIAPRAPDTLGLFLAAGLVGNLVLQALTHAFITLALAPVTGQTLPFVSHGGTALVVSCAQSGIVLNVSRQARRRG